MSAEAKEIIGSLAAIIAVASYVPYIWSTLIGHTKPHAFSWFLWGFPTIMVFVAQWFSGAGAGSWVTGFTGGACMIITILALFKGEKHITRGDWIAFLIALTAIPLWYFTKNALWTIILVMLIDALACYPTLRKCRLNPYQEMPLIYALSIVKFSLGIVALQTYSAVTVIYPLFVIMIEIILLGNLLIWRVRESGSSV